MECPKKSTSRNREEVHHRFLPQYWLSARSSPIWKKREALNLIKGCSFDYYIASNTLSTNIEIEPEVPGGLLKHFLQVIRKTKISSISRENAHRKDLRKRWERVTHTLSGSTLLTSGLIKAYAGVIADNEKLTTVSMCFLLLRKYVSLI